MADKKKAPLHAQKVADLLKRYPDNFLSCRDYGHNWKPDSAAWLQGGGVERIFVCTACGAFRVQTLDRQGYILSNAYRYEKNYTMAGVGRMDRDDRALMRRTNVQRTFAK